MIAEKHMNNVHISVVSPVYKAENIVDELVKRLISALSSVTDSFEIILVEELAMITTTNHS